MTNETRLADGTVTKTVRVFKLSNCRNRIDGTQIAAPAVRLPLDSIEIGTDVCITAFAKRKTVDVRPGDILIQAI